MKPAKKESVKSLALRLGEIQREAKALRIPAVAIIEGLDGSGKGVLLNKMILEMDSRAYNIYSTHAHDAPAREYPFLHRMWNHLPARGNLQIYDRSAYYLALDAWAEGKLKKEELNRYWSDIVNFEQQLSEDGAIVIKVFLVVSKKEQAKRFKKLEANPKTAWRVTAKDWKRNDQHADYLALIKKMVEQTQRDSAPWTLIEADDLKEATTALYETFIAAFETAIAQKQRQLKALSSLSNSWIRYKGPDHLSKVDLSKKLDEKKYKKLLKERQAEIHDLAHQIHEKKIPVVMAYCGWDAAGKGGCIKRLLQGVDPRSFTVVPIGAPTKEELAHHYLWRFWKEMPPRGKITLFDRSWYGRVLVERVEGLCTNEEWLRAYDEINQMEAHLAEYGTVVIKYWLHIDKATQLERFEARQANDHKNWKITSEDWRNREKHDLYTQAINAMIERTNTESAPWNIIPSACKNYARIRTLDIAIDRLKKAVKAGYRAPL